jgi:hypothetical protein
MNFRGMTIGKMLISAIGVIALFVLVVFSGMIFENVGADEVVVIQSPVKGVLEWYTTPGLKWQGFGTPTHYKKRFQYWFSVAADQGKTADQSIKIRFNDGGHGFISGSVSCDMPLDEDHLNMLHAKYGSQAAVEHELVRTVYEKAIYMTGPLMSSKESYAEKRNQLISFIEDQAVNGVYQTSVKQTRDKDLITGTEKTVFVVDLVPDASAPAKLRREEISPLSTFGLKSYNLSINQIRYDPIVEEQIATQQRAIMEVQTAMAESRKAEQRALTAEQEGKANAAKSRWEQEVIKAREVTKAEQIFQVAEWDKKAADQYKQAQVLRGEGDGAYKRLVMEADGALAQKLATYEAVMGRFAQEFGKQKWVSEVSFGGSGASGGDQLSAMINLLSMQALESLGLNLKIPHGQGVKQK